jgi:hypothetical protein
MFNKDNNLNCPPATVKSKKLVKWNIKEDIKLISLVESNDEFKLSKKWKLISSHFTDKTGKQCFSRYNRIKSNIKKGRWGLEEDHKIKDLVNLYNYNWAKISKLINNRTPKQIRDRYINYLDPNLNSNPFTEEEDNIILSFVKTNGKHWVKLSKLINGKSSLSIKNRYFSLIRASKTLKGNKNANIIFLISKEPKKGFHPTENTINLNFNLKLKEVSEEEEYFTC